MRQDQRKGVAAIGVAAVVVGMAAGPVAFALAADVAWADTITEMDYMTEGTADTAIRASLDTCAAETGIEVERQPVPYAELVQKVLLAASSDSLPDLIYIDNSDVAQLAAGGFLTSLDDAGIELEGFVPALAALGTFEGVDYAVPSANNTIALYYNTDKLEAAGVAPPTTWEELRTAAKALTQGDTYGLAFPGINNEQGAFHTSTFVWSNGGSFEVLNSPEVVGALTFLRGLVEDGSVSQSVVTWAIDDARDQFISGRAAMMVGGSWLLPQLDPYPDLHYGVVPMPTPEAGQQVKVPVGGELWVVSATADTELAKTMLECLSSPDVLLAYAEGRNNVPALEALWDEFNAALPRMAPFVQSMAGAVSRTAVLGTEYPRYSQAYSTAMQAILIGEKGAQEALDEAQAAATGE